MVTPVPTKAAVAPSAPIVLRAMGGPPMTGPVDSPTRMARTALPMVLPANGPAPERPPMVASKPATRTPVVITSGAEARPMRLPMTWAEAPRSAMPVAQSSMRFACGAETSPPMTAPGARTATQVPVNRRMIIPRMTGSAPVKVNPSVFGATIVLPSTITPRPVASMVTWARVTMGSGVEGRIRAGAMPGNVFGENVMTTGEPEASALASSIARRSVQRVSSGQTAAGAVLSAALVTTIVTGPAARGSSTRNAAASAHAANTMTTTAASRVRRSAIPGTLRHGFARGQRPGGG